MNAQETAEEKPWNLNEGEKETKLLEWLKEMFRTDGKVYLAITKLEELIARISGLKNERGPKDFDQSEEDVDRVIRIAAERAARTAIHIKHYSEGGEGGKGETSWQKWMLMLAGVLAASGVVALVGMYGRLSAIEANQINQRSEISELKGDVKQLLMRPR